MLMHSLLNDLFVFSVILGTSLKQIFLLIYPWKLSAIMMQENVADSLEVKKEWTVYTSMAIKLKELRVEYSS